MSRMKQTLATVSMAIFITNIAIASAWKDDAKAIDISGGEGHTLVLTANKWPWACGPNSWYQLGIGNTTVSQKVFIRVHGGAMNTPRLQDINDVDAGWKHSLALEGYDPNDPNYMGYVWAWGDNEWSQLGNNTGGPGAYEATPVQVLRGEQVAADANDPDPNLARIIAISAGRSGEHSLAVDANGYAYAWGRNTFGQCGNGDGADSELTPVRVLAGEQDASDPNSPLQQMIAVSAGELHSMGLERDDPNDANFNGCVYTWGDDTFFPEGEEGGVLGTGGTGPSSAVRPVRVWAGEQDYNEPNHVYLKDIVAISAGWDHSMALEKYEVYDPFEPNYDPNHKGRVYTWGDNEASSQSLYGGRLGNGTTTSSSTPVVVRRGQQEPEDPCNADPNLTRIIAISAGEGHSMVLDVDRYVYTWGSNYYGQLGNGCDDPCTTPVRVVGKDGVGYLENIVAISAGYWHSLAVDVNGTIWTWGKGSAGRLGLANKTINCNTPHPIPVVHNVTQNTFAFGIQTAIDDANDAGDTIEAPPATYYENVNFRDKSVMLRSTEPDAPNVVADTIINAAYNSGGDDRFYAAVDFNDGSGSTVTGLTLANAAGCGVWCEDVDCVTIANCLIQDNEWHGIMVDASSANIQNCEIRANTSDGSYETHGVYCISASDVNIANCVIADNEGDGIYCNGSSLGLRNSIIEDNADHGIYSSTGTEEIEIKNNWIYGNGADDSGDGIHIYMAYPVDAVIRNNTVVDNSNYGIHSDYANEISVSNCIIWGNGDGSLHKDHEAFDNIVYSCIEGGFAGTGNISSDPCFVDVDANNFHLNANSPCIDAGIPDFEPDANETDIDGSPRVIGDEVDMGADEFWRETDFSGDGLVNFVDYAMLTSYWRDSGIDYNEVTGLGDANSPSLGEFCDDWLLKAEWWTEPSPLTAGDGTGGMVEGLSLQAAPYELAAVEEKPRIAEPVDVEELLDWLAEIWLDPEVRKAIDAEDWLKLYQSLKE